MPNNSNERRATVTRNTSETKIEAEIFLDGKGLYDVHTGIGFLDHMIEQLSRHSLVDIRLKAVGDLHVDFHHTTEDCGYAIGSAINKALGDRKGITRFADVHIPMDDSLSRVCMDLSGRPYLVWQVDFPTHKLGDMDTELFKEFFQAFTQTIGGNLHICNLYGQNSHHIIESCFKGTARALRRAITLDARKLDDIPSTKGALGTAI